MLPDAYRNFQFISISFDSVHSVTGQSELLYLIEWKEINNFSISIQKREHFQILHGNGCQNLLASVGRNLETLSAFLISCLNEKGIVFFKQKRYSAS